MRRLLRVSRTRILILISNLKIMHIFIYIIVSYEKYHEIVLANEKKKKKKTDEKKNTLLYLFSIKKS